MAGTRRAAWDWLARNGAAGNSTAWLLAAVACLAGAATVRGQSYGVEPRNTLMPASGGMGGTSVARPQDLLSGINGNPATLSQFKGTQFLFGGAFAEATLNLEQTGNLLLPGVTPFAAKSATPGSLLPNLGVTQELTAFGLPATVGLGVIGAAGAGTDFRSVDASNGTSTYLLTLDTAAAAAVQVSDRLAVGTSPFVGSSYLDGPFLGTGAMTNAYALRGSVGVDYQLLQNTTLGFYYQTGQRFRFRDAVRLQLFDGSFDVARDIHLAMPRNFGIGLANSDLLDGRLLLAADVLYLNWTTADLFENIYINQWVLQTGMQFTVNPKTRLRLGYALAQNPINPDTGNTAGGILPPGSVPAIKYLQAQFAVISQHRLSAGVGVSNVLPGLDFDAYAGGMFQASQQLGDFTQVSIESYWLGFGFTWRFDRGSCCGTGSG